MEMDLAPLNLHTIKPREDDKVLTIEQHSIQYITYRTNTVKKG